MTDASLNPFELDQAMRASLAKLQNGPREYLTVYRELCELGFSSSTALVLISEMCQAYARTENGTLPAYLSHQGD